VVGVPAVTPELLTRRASRSISRPSEASAWVPRDLVLRVKRPEASSTASRRGGWHRSRRGARSQGTDELPAAPDRNLPARASGHGFARRPGGRPAWADWYASPTCRRCSAGSRAGTVARQPRSSGARLVHRLTPKTFAWQMRSCRPRRARPSCARWNFTFPSRPARIPCGRSRRSTVHAAWRIERGWSRFRRFSVRA